MRVAQAAPATNEVLTWNETALKVAAAGGQQSIQVSRTLAMVQGAVHDALNVVTRRYAAYYFDGPGEAGASPEAAVATAAHTVLVGVIPSAGTPARRSPPSLWWRTRIWRRCAAAVTAPPRPQAWRWAVPPARPCWRSARTTAPPRTPPTRRAPATASSGRTRTPTRRTRRSRTKSWPPATRQRTSPAGATSRPSPYSPPCSTGPRPPGADQRGIRPRLQRDQARRRPG